jgi:hypothetical protein
MILLRRRPDGLVGVVTAPYAKAPWIFDQPISQKAVAERLREEGNHPTDIGDVLYEAERNGFGYLP